MASSVVKEIMTSFLESLAYQHTDPITDDNDIYQSMLSEFSSYNDGGGWFIPTCRSAASMTELSYPRHARDVRLQIARCTWFLLHMDDLGQRYPSSLGAFLPRVLGKTDTTSTTTSTTSHEIDILLQAFRENLTEFYRFWDTVPANSITLAAMDFMNASLIEQMSGIRDVLMKLAEPEAARAWPYYLRCKVGASSAFAFMLFPKDMNIDISVYIPAMSDIILFTDLANDILSFHKESLAGETNNYIHNRARVTQKSVLETLQDVVDETLAACARITKVLQSTDAAIPWKRYVNGYLAFHVTEKRYRLSELGFE